MENLKKELEQLRIKIDLREAKTSDIDKILCILENGYMNENDYVFVGNFYNKEHIKTILDRKIISKHCFEFMKEESQEDEWMIENAESRLKAYYEDYVSKIK